MAKLQRIRDEHLSCAICQEVFTEPIALSCHHHFCKNCLVEFTRTRPDVIVQGCLPCATCRRLTPVPDAEKPIEEWPKQLHTGFFVQGLIDALTSEETQNSAESDSESCSPCQEEGDIIKATKWCTDCETALCPRCFRLHQRFESTRDHLICEVDDKKMRGRPKLKCDIHREKRVEIFCRDCKVGMCHICSTTSHRKCKSVTSLAAAVPYFIHSLMEKSQELETINLSAKKWMSRNKAQCRTLEDDIKRAKQEYETITQNLLEVILAKQNSLRNKIEEIEKYDLGQLRNAVSRRSKIIEENCDKVKEIQSTIESGTDAELCMEFLKCCKTEESPVSECLSVVTNVTFTNEAGRLHSELNQLGLGRLITTTSLIDSEIDDSEPGRVSTQISNLDKPASTARSTPVLQDPKPQTVATDDKFSVGCKEEAKPVLKHSLDTKISNDKLEPDINDVIAMNIDGTETIIVADHSNRNVKSFYKQGRKQRHSWLRLEDIPNNMTIIERKTIGITVPLLQQIVLVDVMPDLIYLRTINTTRAYNGLVSINPSTFLAGTNNSVDYIDMDGKIIKSIVKDKMGSRLFTNPYYMTKGPGNLVAVTDSAKKRVVVMTQKGEVTAIYSPTGRKRLVHPCGLCMNENKIFVADSGSRKVIQVKVSGEHERDLITANLGLKNPESIFLVGDDIICVGDKRFVKTYHFSI